MEWISLKDRIPDQNGHYLVYTFWREWFVADFIRRGDNYSWDVQGVTHWMPLPDPLDDFRLGDCPDCRGLGRIDDRECPSCEGSGVGLEAINYQDDCEYD